MTEAKCATCGNNTECEVDENLGISICPVCIANLTSEAMEQKAQIKAQLLSEPATRRMQVGGDHYKHYNFQPWDIIEEYNLDYFLGNVIKYILRHEDKGGIEDLKKAQHYLAHKIFLMEQ